jgi:hypothetical protein
MVLVLRAVGARGVHDDGDGFVVGVFSVADLTEGAEELGSNVGEDAGALGGNAIADEEKQEPCEKLVDLIEGVEFGELVEKVGREVVGILLAVVEAGMAEAETGAGIPDGEPTRMTCTGALLATDSAFRLAAFSVSQVKLGRGDRQVLRRERVK